MSKPIRVFYNELSGRFYASSAYSVKPGRNGRSLVTITGQKFDVTNEIAAAVIEHDLEFTVADEPKEGE